MNYILGYLFMGVLVTMFFEFIFQVVDKEDDELKFDSYGERLLFTIAWPFVVYFFIMELVPKK